jgi:OOP family OmpA-OmpF porin
MNAKQIVATGIVATMLGLGPTIASAEGFYLTGFGGISSLDVDKGSFDASYIPVLDNNVSVVLTDATDDDHTFTAVGRNYRSGSVDDSSIGWGLQVGYEFNPYVAMEIGYVDLGKARQEGGSLVARFSSETALDTFDVNASTSARVVSSGPTLAVVGKFPFGAGFSVYGRGGLLFADTRVRLKYIGTIELTTPDTQLEAPVEFKASTQELFAGLGAGWDFSEDFGLRVDLQHFLNVGDSDRTGESDATLLSLGVTFR